MATTGQRIPTRIYQTAERIRRVAPMPGFEPEDISARIQGRHVTIRGRERGPHQHDREVAVAERTVGPDHREIDLQEPVTGSISNATYDNGGLVLSMPP
jgi:HSP20 family molecular chaperone IbpA